MAKRIYWTLLILVSLAGLTTLIYFGIQPRPVPKIQLSKFENPNILANSILLRLRQEIKESAIILLGYEPDEPDQALVWQHFLQNAEPGMNYDEVMIDASIDKNLFSKAQMVNFKEDFQKALSLIDPILKSHKRVAILAPSSYTAQAIPGNLAHFLNLNLPTKATSFSILNFPRSREDEKKSSFPCVVEGVDQSGLGPFGCLLVQSARSQYRKRYSPGEHIGFVNQIGLKDFIVFYTQEK